MFNYRNDLRQQEVAASKAAYDSLLTRFNDLHTMQGEGVYEVTLRSHSHTVTVHVDAHKGSFFAVELSEVVEDRLGLVEKDLNVSIENAGFDARIDRERQERGDAQHKQNLVHVQQELAQQAATPAPKQLVGRPRKEAARPRPEVMEAMGQSAAMVPMNGSTANAAARATNLPSA